MRLDDDLGAHDSLVLIECALAAPEQRGAFGLGQEKGPEHVGCPPTKSAQQLHPRTRDLDAAHERTWMDGRLCKGLDYEDEAQTRLWR